jgi:hypothetical protein
MANLPIVVDGPGGSFRTASRQDGTFHVSGLKPGSYRVSLVLPDTLMYTGSTDPVRIASAHACERVDFSVHYDGRITGSVRDARGTPVVGANVVLSLAELADDAVGVRHNRSAVTDAKGAYELRKVPPGGYVLGVNIEPNFEHIVLRRGVKGQWIWPRVFFPGSFDASHATRIDLGAGEKRALPPLQLPKDLLVRHVTGTARWPDGRPVAEGWVSLHDGDRKMLLAVVRTTSNGEFKVAAFAGQRVFVQVSGDTGDRSGYVESSRFKIGSGAAPAPLRLTLKPQPSLLP